MKGLGALGALSQGLQSYQNQIDRQKEQQIAQLKLQQQQVEFKYLQQQQKAAQWSDKLDSLAYLSQNQPEQAPPPGPYDVSQSQPPQQSAPPSAPGGLPGAQPMPPQMQGGPQQPQMLPGAQMMRPQGMPGQPQGMPPQGMRPPMQGQQPPPGMQRQQGMPPGGAPPQQMQRPPMPPQGQPGQQPQQQGGVEGIGPPPTMQTAQQFVMQQAHARGIDLRQAPPGAVRQAMQNVYKQQVEDYKLKLEGAKADAAENDRRQTIRDREEARREHEQDIADARRDREEMHAESERDRMAMHQDTMALSRDRGQIFQDKNGNLVRVTNDGKAMPIEGTQGLSKVGAKQAPQADLSDKATKEMVDQYLAGDKSVLQNIGRGAQGSANIAKFRNTLADTMDKQGITGAAQATKMAEFTGLTAGERSLGTRSAQMGMAVDEAKRIMPLALQASEAFPRTQFVPLNKAIASAKAGTGDPAVSRFVAANQSLINVYARAMSPTGVPTVSDKDHAREMLSVAQTKEQYRAVLDQMRLEMESASKAPGDVKVELGESGSPASPPAASSGGWSIEPVK